MMRIRQAAFLISLSLSGVVLAASFAMRALWPALAALPVMGLFWLLARRNTTIPVATILFISYIALMGVGILSGITPYLALIGVAAALAAWDLSLFQQSLAGEPPPDLARLFEADHLQSLAYAIALGLLLGILSLFVRLALPFVVVALVALLMGVGVEWARRRLGKDRM